MSVGRLCGLIATNGVPSSSRSADMTASSFVIACFIASRAISGGADDMPTATHSTRALSDSGVKSRRSTNSRVAVTKSRRKGSMNASASRLGPPSSA
jgi:hypothetical protein